MVRLCYTQVANEAEIKVEEFNASCRASEGQKHHDPPQYKPFIRTSVRDGQSSCLE